MYDHFARNVGHYLVGMVVFINAFLIGQIYGGWLARRNLLADLQPRFDKAVMRLNALTAWAAGSGAGRGSPGGGLGAEPPTFGPAKLARGVGVA